MQGPRPPGYGRQGRGNHYGPNQRSPHRPNSHQGYAPRAWGGYAQGGSPQHRPPPHMYPAPFAQPQGYQVCAGSRTHPRLRASATDAHTPTPPVDIWLPLLPHTAP